MTKLLVAAVLLTAALPCHSFDGRAGYLVPEIGSWFGVAESWNTSVASYISLLGVEPVAYTYYINFPFSPSDRTYLDNFVNEVGARKGIIVLTVEPYQGLATVTDAAIQDLVASIAQWEKNGVIFIVRFAHEMNGSWNNWSSRPILFKSTWQRVATAVKAGTQSATMLWAPGVGIGYPYLGEQYPMQCDIYPDECAALDTNGDGNITQSDDMYDPYWPGAEYVDFVGMSVYWFGEEYPFGKNDIPPSSAFAGQLNGNIIWGTPVQLPNFYANYSVAYDKPMVVAETGAFYNLCDVFPGRMGCAANANGPTQLQVKSAWWQQAFNLMDAPQGPSIATAFPNIKLISWYDVTMRQVEASGNTVDWDVSQQADLRTAFVQYIQTPLVDANGQSIQYWKFAGDWRNQEGLVLPSFSPPPSSPPHPRPPKSPNSTHPKPKSPKHKSPKPPKSPTSKVGRRFMM